jgi:outer membrane protein assembly factor BamB
MVVAVGSWAWAGESWTQWGGPNQDFKAASTGLASSWPDEGPKKIWERELGDGYSAILVEDGRLYTMYRDGEEEVAICLEAGSGETIWEQRYAHKPAQGHVSQFGEGPRSTPLISGNQIFTIGVAGRMHSLDKKTGKVQWSHELWGEEFGGNFLQHGYASSPIDYGNTVIALVGGEDKSIVAFKKKDGKIVWKSESFKNSYATPKIMKVAGSDQLVTFMAAELVGLDPKTGELKWSYSFGNQFGQNISRHPVLVVNPGRVPGAEDQQGWRGGRGLVDTEDPVLPRLFGKDRRLRLWLDGQHGSRVHVRDQHRDG